MIERWRTIARDYAALRRAEGRARWEADDLAALPWPSGRMPEAWEWPIRAASFECLFDLVFPAARAAATEDRAPRALDLGAGLGWLGHRMAWSGWEVLALDLCPDPGVGLGAATLLQEGLDWARATEAGLGRVDLALGDYHRLPLSDGCVQLAVFNAALHYSWDLQAALDEAWRCLAPGGRLAIMDSPFYEHEAAGQAMVEAQRRAFGDRWGQAAAAPEGRGFLSLAALRMVTLRPAATWQVLTPRRGWRWHLRRAWRRWRLGRESADFPLVVAVKP